MQRNYLSSILLTNDSPVFRNTWSDILHSDQDVAQPVEYIWSTLVKIDEILSGFIWTIYTLHRPESDLIIIHLESSKFINSQLAVIILKW